MESNAEFINRIERTIKRWKNPAYRGWARSVPFYINADLDKLDEDCDYMSSSWHSDFKQEIYRCSYDEHVAQYRITGQILLSCHACPYYLNRENQNIINQISLTLSETR